MHTSITTLKVLSNFIAAIQLQVSFRHKNSGCPIIVRWVTTPPWYCYMFHLHKYLDCCAKH